MTMQRNQSMKMFLLVLCVGIIAMVQPAAGKSVYLSANHHTGQFDAWNIGSTGLISKHGTYSLHYSTDPAGIGIDAITDNDEPIMFISSEFSAGLEIINPVTLEYIGVSAGPSNLGGVDVDDLDNIVYSLRRGTRYLYVFQWDPTAKTITQLAQVTLPGMSNGYGIALDDSRDVLWVTDSPNNVVRAYDVNVSDYNNIVEIPSMSFSSVHSPIDVTVDSKRNLVYTAGGWGGSPLLAKYDVDAGVETNVDCGSAMGIAVDEITGYVYITRGGLYGYYAPCYDDMQVWDCSTTPFTLIQDNIPDLGNPAGIAIANEGQVTVNPLNLAKNDVVQGIGVPIGQQFTYEITCDNLDNTVDVTGVMIRDDLPIELDYISETVGGVPGTGVYDAVAHTVTWNIGTILAGDTGPLIDLVVKINENATEGETIYNYANIWGDEVDTTTVIPDPPCDTCDPGTMPLPPAYTCYPDLLAPQLVFEGIEDYEVNGNLFTRYLLTVTNWADYPDELFELSPDLPACGLNDNSSRSWVKIYKADGSYIYGFCALGVSTKLQDIWFAVPRGDCPPAQIYIEINDRRCDINYASNIVPIVGDISGVVLADCPTPGTGLLGVEIDLYNADGDLVANTITDVDGHYEMPCVLVDDYTLTIVTPLGYQVPDDELPVTVIGNEVVTVNFSLTCVEITAEPRTIGFWKHQVGVATGGKGKAQIDETTLCDYLDLIEDHFNGNAINHVIVYQPPVSGLCPDKLMVLKSLMNLKGSVDMIDRAKQQLMALLLNVASGKLSQTEIISADGATVSQAITYCDNVIDNPAGDYEMAKTICDEINNNRMVPADMIPLSTASIAYKFGGLPGDYVLAQNYPNPFNPSTEIRFFLPEPTTVRLDVFNIVGQKVATLFEGFTQAGEHLVVWKAESQASGVYLYRLTTADFVETKKMVLLK